MLHKSKSPASDILVAVVAQTLDVAEAWLLEHPVCKFLNHISSRVHILKLHVLPNLQKFSPNKSDKDIITRTCLKVKWLYIYCIKYPTCDIWCWIGAINQYPLVLNWSHKPIPPKVKVKMFLHCCKFVNRASRTQSCHW